ncbi:MAG: nucleotidyl transferase AbiEii/AbiGii toxin family protein [Oscillospiraceae bacterium]|nr:nucleotidyl transferase AbiEii/AbiGii toxin family protein [Oscillospiraceae bacterium]
MLEYKSVVDDKNDAVQSAVLLETSFAEVSFPTVFLPVHSYIGDMMTDEAPEQLSGYKLDPFEMKVQGLDRTLADKVFAVCDYYLQNKVEKHSRHIYDIYKLLSIVPLTNDFKVLVHEVRNVRALTNICPSAQPEINVTEILRILIEQEIYKDDYEKITSRILEEDVKYETAIEAIKTIIETGIFDKV